MTHIIHSLEAIKNLLDDICMRIRNEEAETVRVENVFMTQEQFNRLRGPKRSDRSERPKRAPLKDLTIRIVNMMQEPTSETLDRIWCDPDDYTRIFQPHEFRDAFVTAGLSETFDTIMSYEIHHSTRGRILRLAIRGLRADLVQRLCVEASESYDYGEYEA